MREPEMQEWGGKMKPEDKRAYPLSEELELAIDRFFFTHYCQSFRRGAFARANCSMCVVLFSFCFVSFRFRFRFVSRGEPPERL